MIESGIGVGINNISYNSAYSFSYKKTEGYWAGSMWNPYYLNYPVAMGKSGLIEEKDTFNDFFINLSFDLNFNMPFGMNLGLNIQNTYFILQLGYNF